ncbi:MAG: hypothetical protein ACKO3R_08590 [bacterium]
MGKIIHAMELDPRKIFNQWRNPAAQPTKNQGVESGAEKNPIPTENLREQAGSMATPPDDIPKSLIEKLMACTRDEILRCFYEAEDEASYVNIEAEELQNLKVTKIISKPEADEYQDVICTIKHKPLYLLAENQKGEECVLELILQFNQIGPVCINILNTKENTIAHWEWGQDEIASNIFKQVIPNGAHRLGNSQIIENQLFIDPSLSQ